MVLSMTPALPLTRRHIGNKGNMSGTLFVVSTPIGNLEDITFRAVSVLKDADIIAAEDTRITKKLLSHYGISTRIESYYEHNEKEKAPLLVERLKKGEVVALVSDAGTPGISDPGYRLIRLAIENSIPVISIPGPSAIISALSISGLPLNEFTFKGFIPQSESGKKEFFLAIKGTEHTYVMYESARRLMDTLNCAEEILGDIEIVVARELTKLYEEVLRGAVSSVKEKFTGRELKGEITLILRTKKAVKETRGLREELKGLLKEGFKLNEVVKTLSKEYGLPKSTVYKEALFVKAELSREQD